jgi:hypothetical protein
MLTQTSALVFAALHTPGDHIRRAVGFQRVTGRGLVADGPRSSWYTPEGRPCCVEPGKGDLQAAPRDTGAQQSGLRPSTRDISTTFMPDTSLFDRFGDAAKATLTALDAVKVAFRGTSPCWRYRSCPQWSWPPKSRRAERPDGRSRPDTAVNHCDSDSPQANSDRSVHSDQSNPGPPPELAL